MTHTTTTPTASVLEKPQNWIVAGQEGDVLKPNRLKRFSLLLPKL